MFKKLGMAALAGAATYGLASKHRDPFDPYRPGPVPPGWQQMMEGSYHTDNADGTFDSVTYYRYIRMWNRRTHLGGRKDDIDHGFFETFDEAINFKPKGRRARPSATVRQYVQANYPRLTGSQPRGVYSFFDSRIVYVFDKDGKLIGWGKFKDKVSLPNFRQVLDGELAPTVFVDDAGVPRVNMARLRLLGRSAKGRRADDAEYAKWLNTSKKLNARVDATSAVMQQFPKGAMGLTPEAVRFSVEFKAADAAFQRAFRMLQDFNKNSPKAFLRRASAERRARRWGSSARGRRAAPTLKQRKAMGQKLQALPWNQASALYKRNHPQYKGIGGYPMDTKLRASGARSYAVAAYNDGKLTKKDVETIFRRTSRRYPSMPKFDGLVCKKTRKNAKRRKCSSVTSR